MISSFPPPSLTPARVYARYAEETCEIDAELALLEGEVPRALEGVLLRNGPGRTHAHGRAYGHPFDGDGMVHGFTFDRGSVRYRNRWLRTREFLEEQRAGRNLYRNFGTNRPGGSARNFLRTRFKNPANTSIVSHAGRTLALWEGGLPHAIDPVSLATLGRHDFAGVLTRAQGPIDRLLSPETPFTAHPKIDPSSGELFAFGLARGLRSRLLVYCVSPAGVMEEPRAVPLDELSYVHDFVLTERYLVFVVLPMAFDTARMLLGRATAVEALELRGENAKVLVVPRRGGEPRWIDAGRLYTMHHLNGFDTEHGIVIDSLVMEEPPPIAELGGVFSGDHPYPDPHLTRLTIDLRPGTVARERLFERPMEFASSPASELTRPTTVGYAVGSAEGADRGALWHARKRARSPSFTGIVRADLASRTCAFLDLGNGFPCEPTHVRAADGDELVLTVVYRPKTHRSELHVLDAADLSPRAVLAIPQHVPPGFHGCFVNS